MGKIVERVVVQYLHEKSLAPMAIHADMVATLRKDASSYAAVKRWVAKFKCGRESFEDDPLHTQNSCCLSITG